MLKNLWNSEAGFVISAELALVLTIGVIGVIVGLSHVANAVNNELDDVAKAIGSLNQSYNFTGYKCCPCSTANGSGSTSATAGSVFVDQTDTCDGDNTDCTDVTTCAAAAEVPKT